MSGVRSFNLRPQTWVQTEPDGWSNSDDYALGVWDANGVRVPPGTPIPPGEYVSVGGPAPGRPPAPSPSIPAQTAAANNTLALSGATANNAQAAAATKNAQTAADTLTATTQRNAQLHDEFLANLGLTKQQIDNQYNKDVASLGIEKATLLLQSRTAAATVASQQANFLLSQNQFNAQQRQEMGRQTLDALKMLADRNGPQDWTRWDYMSAGENSPTPTSSKTYSPLEMIQSQYQPSNIAAPAGLDLSGIDFSGGGMPPASTAGAPASTTTAPAGQGGVTGVSGIQPRNGDGSLVNYNVGPQNSAANQQAITAQQSSYPMTTGTSRAGAGYGVTPPSGMSIMPDGTVRRDPSPQQTLTDTMTGIANGTIARPPGLAEGGSTTGPAIVGDRPGQSNAEIKNDPHTELVYSAKNPQTGVVETHVIPHAQLAQMMDKEMGRSGGMVMGMHKVPKEMAAIMPHMATGGTLYSSNGVQDQSKFQGQIPGEGMAGGNPGYTPIINQGGPDMGGTKTMPTPMTPTPTSYQPPQPLTNPSTATAPQSAPGQMAYGTTSNGSTAAITPGPQAVTTGAPTAVGGQVANLGGAIPSAVSLGPGQYDPYRITKNTYSGDTMNNSPVLQMIRGQRPVYSFGGHGSFAPSVPSQGITDLPTNLNYGDLLRMDPNRVKMLQGLYNNPESGWSWDTVLNDAKNAAPKTANFGVTRAR